MADSKGFFTSGSSNFIRAKMLSLPFRAIHLKSGAGRVAEQASAAAICLTFCTYILVAASSAKSCISSILSYGLLVSKHVDIIYIIYYRL